jgi:transposase-like protein
MGRPTLYTPELAERILHELADGRSVRDICRADGMPAAATVRLWVIKDRDGFAARFRRARECAYHDMEEELREIVDDGRNDWIERRARARGRETVPNRENIQRSRLRYEARRWLLSNALPKFYGNRIAPDAKDEASNPRAEIPRLVDGKTRGLPSEDQPIDQCELEEFERKFQKAAGPPIDRL